MAMGLLCTATLAACERNPAEPALETAQQTEWSGANLSSAVANDQHTRAFPSLRQLLRRALAKVKHEQGEDAVLALLADLTQLRHEARAAHEVGDRDTARAKMEAAHLEAARIVTTVFGATAAERTVNGLGTAITRTNERIAAAETNGHDVARAKEFATRLTALHAEASQALAEGDAALALHRSMHGIEALRRLQQRQQHRRRG
jgi:hypothetical protein